MVQKTSPIWKQPCPDWAFQSKSTKFHYFLRIHLTQMVLTFTNSNIPKSAHSLPKPEFFTPPKGKDGSDRTKSFTKHMPASMSSTAMRSPWWNFWVKIQVTRPPSQPVAEKIWRFVVFFYGFSMCFFPGIQKETHETVQMRLPGFLQVTCTSSFWPLTWVIQGFCSKLSDPRFHRDV